MTAFAAIAARAASLEPASSEYSSKKKVAAITWRGELPADQFDAFAVLFKLPDQAATLYFPTVQSCGADESQWTEIPSAGERASHPAPALVVTPKAAAAETHQH